MLKVLIVDDDKLARKGLEMIIPWERYGMVVAGEAANGAKAIEFLEQNEADLLIVDLAMPVMTGLELMATCKKRWPEVQFAVMSCREDFASVQAALRLGALDYISKVELGQSDCDAVFARIGERIAANKAASKAAAEQGGCRAATEQVDGPLGESGRLLADLRDEWLEFNWLYFDDDFKRMKEKTLAANVSPRWLEHLLVRAQDAAPFKLADAQPIPSLNSLDEGFLWLSAFAAAIFKEAHGDNNLQEARECVIKAVEFIRRRHREPLTLNDAARAVGMSRSSFAAAFKASTGRTFNHFLRLVRVEAAKRLLASGEAAPESVGGAVGYADEKYFAQLFTQETGMSPQCYHRSVGS